MNAYYEVLRVLKFSLENNKDIHAVTQGDISTMDLNKMNIYPLGHIDLDDGTFRENTIEFNCSIYAMDVIDTSNELTTDKFIGNDNEIDVFNTMLAVVRRTYLELSKDVYTNDITILGEPTIRKMEGAVNNLAGWEMTFTIEVPDTIISVC